jgi:DNA-binding MarR family transcriptional regulator
LHGIELASESLASAVHETSLADLSATDKIFLAAMAIDDGSSKMSDIANRMKKDSGYVGQYRKRLIEEGIIVETSYGHVDFAIPLMREYIRSN